MEAGIGIKWIIGLLSISWLLMSGEAYDKMTCQILNRPELTATAQAKTLSFPDGSMGKYGSNQRCEWKIKTANPKHVVKVTVEYSQIEGRNFQDECVSDYVNIFYVKDNHVYFVDRFCGTKDVGKSFKSSSPYMMVQFISNEKYEFTGFRLSYVSVPRASSSSSASKKGMAIGIPVGVITFCIIICLGVCFSRWWQSKRAAQRRNSQERNSSRLQPQAILTEPPYPGRSFGQPIPYAREDPLVLNPHPSLRGLDPHPSLRGLDPDPSRRVFDPYPAIPLRVALEEPTQERSATPPPSYEYLVRHESLLGPQGEPLPDFPPDYETTVKNDAMQGHESPV